MLEPRKASKTKFSPLPVDYLKMVNEVFTANFDTGLKALRAIKPESARFESTGQIFADEVVIAVSLMHGEQLAATTVYASSDFDPKASSPTVQDVLAACVDAIGAVFTQLFSTESPSNLEGLAAENLSAFEEVPLLWTPITLERHQIFVKVDKANPMLDQMADDWLNKNDPDYQKHLDEEARETEKLFFTGPKGMGPTNGKKTKH